MVIYMKQNSLLDVATSLEKKYLIDTKKEKEITINHYKIAEKEKNIRNGNHFTLSYNQNILYQHEETIEKIFTKVFYTFLKKYHKDKPILVIGLGNNDVLGDSFGPKIIDNLIATNQYNDFLTIPKVALFSPSTTAKTGISSYKLIEMVVNHIKPDILIIIDSFKTTKKENLNYNIEINDCGIIFAEELRHIKSIDSTTFNTPIISIGYPCLWKTSNGYFQQFNLEQDLNQTVKIVSKCLNKIVLKR